MSCMQLGADWAGAELDQRGNWSPRLGGGGGGGPLLTRQMTPFLTRDFFVLRTMSVDSSDETRRDCDVQSRPKFDFVSRWVFVVYTRLRFQFPDSVGIMLRKFYENTANTRCMHRKTEFLVKGIMKQVYNEHCGILKRNNFCLKLTGHDDKLLFSVVPILLLCLLL